MMGGTTPEAIAAGCPRWCDVADHSYDRDNGGLYHHRSAPVTFPDELSVGLVLFTSDDGDNDPPKLVIDGGDAGDAWLDLDQAQELATTLLRLSATADGGERKPVISQADYVTLLRQVADELDPAASGSGEGGASR
jgi:hypothetical protein